MDWLTIWLIDWCIHWDYNLYNEREPSIHPSQYILNCRHGCWNVCRAMAICPKSILNGIPFELFAIENRILTVSQNFNLNQIRQQKRSTTSTIIISINRRHTYTHNLIKIPLYTPIIIIIELNFHHNSSNFWCDPWSELRKVLYKYFLLLSSFKII